MKQRIRIEKTKPNTGVLDYSYLLDAPAGKHGFVKVKNGHFYFEDGMRARFLGFNVAARSNTPDHELAEKLAKRFASMGVNVIRLHAADAPISEESGSWASCKEAPLLDYEAGNSRKFHSEGLDRFDYFVAQLKKQGIYLHIDLIVAREFVEGDDLDYPGKVGSCVKRFPMYNQRLIELQKEYAKKLLCHVNPYTGLALIDDPAVMTVQINNEDSAIKGTMETDSREEMQPYRDEVQKRFNQFLSAKYGTREALEEAWTFEGISALRKEEDPLIGTVAGVDGNFYQPVNDPLGDWNGNASPARYADFMEFGIERNRIFYRDMKDYLRSLGVKVPIVTSNLIAGAADVYGHTDGDFMENTHLCMMESTYAAANSIAGVSGVVQKNPEEIKTVPGTHIQSDETEEILSVLRRQKPECRSLLEELKERMPETEILYAYGYPIAGEDQSGFEEALKAVEEADMVLLTLGGKHGTCSMASMGEGVDSTNINLPLCQDAFILAAASYKKPMVGVHFDGRPVSSDTADQYLDALLEAWNPAECGAKAVVDILLGVYNPGGKLPVSVAYHAGQIPVYYNHPNGSAWHQGESIGFVNYVDLPHTPRYCFGYGLSYTTFNYSNLHISKKQVHAAEDIKIACDVKNDGNYKGDEVVQLYLRDEYASRTRPVKELTGFCRVTLEPGETKRIVFEVNTSQMAFLDENMKWKIEKGRIGVEIGSSSEDIRLKGSYEVVENGWLEGRKRKFWAKAEVKEIEKEK